MSIIIKKNPNGDTRTAPKDISFEEFQIANDMHKEDVRLVMFYLASLISKAGMARALLVELKGLPDVKKDGREIVLR